LAYAEVSGADWHAACFQRAREGCCHIETVLGWRWGVIAGRGAASDVPFTEKSSVIAVRLHKRSGVQKPPFPRRGTVTSRGWQLVRESSGMIVFKSFCGDINDPIEAEVPLESACN
jgi:hypothetical protein